ncbi:hypothetical protein Acr_00g0048060 [Actinidia rufa]|uniref:Uncharacterized protein n=1 Tax=Actinidia rufa TaxID=165716 RepID=A0A7J0DK04_9ERIC|nr:hypothetical protein Acr_00g0048060 [Actinidia rufa]
MPELIHYGYPVKHIRQGSRGISLLHSSGRSKVPSDVQQAVSRSGMSVQKLSLYTPAGRKAAEEGGGHWARSISSEFPIQLEAPIKKILRRLRDRDSVTEEIEATTEGTAAEAAADKDRRIRKKPSWMEDYQILSGRNSCINTSICYSSPPKLEEVSIGAFIHSVMAEGTRLSKIDEAIKEDNRDFYCSRHFSEESPMNLPSVSNNNHSNHQFRSMKIEVPHFDGSDVSSWVFKMEQFFQFYNTPEDQRVLISSFHLEGPALSWFKWMHSNGFIESWKGFLKAINLRFRPSLYEDNRGVLSKLQQTTTVANYQAQFEDLSTKYPPGHKYKSKFFLLVGDEDDSDTIILEELNTAEDSVVAASSGIPEVPACVQPLLQQFSDIFEEPSTLPPLRENDHQIHLKQDANPVNVRPYRYPHFQKSEMEKLVQEMLHQGIITISHSPFSSPVLLDIYRRFIQGHAAIATTPLTNLLKKDAFVWDSLAHTSFEELKWRMTQAPVLAMPNFSLPFDLETDASNYAIGAVLMQQEAVAKWRHYLLGNQFVIKTDHRSLKHLMNQVIQTPEQHHYLSKLLGFNYTIVYKPGKENSVADALSRREDEQEVKDSGQLVSSEGGSSCIEAVDNELLTREELLLQLKLNLLKAQKRMKLQADGHRKDLVFQEGDLVMVKVHPYKQQSLAQRLNYKLSQRYFGPFLVTRRIGQVAYQLDLPHTSKIHPVFHVSQLKPFSGTGLPSVVMQLPEINLGSQIPVTLVAIVNSRTITVNGQLKSQVLIQWKGWPIEDSTWEDVDVLQEVFPHFNLADQVYFDEGGNVTNSVTEEIEATAEGTVAKESDKIPTDQGVYVAISELVAHDLPKRCQSPNPLDRGKTSPWDLAKSSPLSSPQPPSEYSSDRPEPKCSSPLGEPWSDLHAGGGLSGLAPALYFCSSVQVAL